MNSKSRLSMAPVLATLLVILIGVGGASYWWFNLRHDHYPLGSFRTVENWCDVLENTDGITQDKTMSLAGKPWFTVVGNSRVSGGLAHGGWKTDAMLGRYTRVDQSRDNAVSDLFSGDTTPINGSH